MQRVGSRQKELIQLSNSYHVATLDYDAPFIFERTLQFLRQVAP
jgi:carboxylesterase